MAKKALKTYRATHLITSLEMGWELALAKAALELDVAFTAALPYPGRDTDWGKPVRRYYYDLLSQAVDVYQIGEMETPTALLESHFWRVDHAEVVLTLWDYEFSGNTYETMCYALEQNKTVANLWKDWETLYGIRKHSTLVVPARKKKGARIYNNGGQTTA